MRDPFTYDFKSSTQRILLAFDKIFLNYFNFIDGFGNRSILQLIGDFSVSGTKISVHRLFHRFLNERCYE